MGATVLGLCTVMTRESAASGSSSSIKHDPLRVKNLKTEKRTWIVQAGQNGQYVGKVLVRWEKGKGINLEKYEMIPLTEDIEDDPQIAGLLP